MNKVTMTGGLKGVEVSRVYRSKRVPYIAVLTAPILLSVLLLTGCSTSEPVTDREPVATVSDSPTPDWFREGVIGEATGGRVSGFGLAAGRSPHLATGSARELAKANFKQWVDSRLEEARMAEQTDMPALTAPEFIRELRLAVSGLASDDLAFRSDSFESDGVVYGVVRADLPASEVISRIGSSLDRYPQAWSRLTGADAIQEWMATDGE